MLKTLDAKLGTYSPLALGIFRIVVGLLFALHGTAKLFDWPVENTVPVGVWPYWWAALIEFGVGVLVMLGLFTRIAALLGSGAMAYAYFTEHQPAALWPIQNQGELAVLYCFAFFLIAFSGPGSLALKRIRRR